MRGKLTPKRTGRPNAAPKPTTTTEYLRALSAEQRGTLRRLCAAIRAAVPEAAEGFSYGMPAFTVGGRPLLWAAAWKRHYSLYPVSAAQAAAVAGPGDAYEVAKGTVRFRADRAVPYAFVGRLARARADERAGRSAPVRAD
jgi:uncharacterized protein YdhG (YjbR/CyaY superfamily)